MTNPDPAPWPTLVDVAPTRPVAVVGAGPVGQTAALLLARWGVPVVLYDDRAERDPAGSKAICQARDVLDVWETVGAGHRLATEGVTWTTARTHYRDREVSAWTFVDRGRSPFPPFVNIGQHRTEAVLDERLDAARRLVIRRRGHRLTGLDQHADGVRLTFATAAGEVTGEAPYAVVATGARSEGLRSRLGVSFDGETFDDQFLICDVRVELPGWERERRFYFDPEWNPGRQVLIHPCPGSVYRIDWQVPDDYDLDADERSGGLDGRIRRIVGDRPYEIVWKSAYRFHSRHVDRMRVGRVLLAGDVAHLVAPFGARGLNTGVLDAENAAWKLAFVLHGWSPDGLLDSYDHERLAATRENIEVTAATMRFLVPRSPAEHDHRRAVLEAAAADPQRAGAVDSGRFAEPFWYVGSPLTTPDARRRFAGRPPRGESPPPGPGVLLPDVPIAVAGRPGVTRLRELAREGLLVLTGAQVDTGRVAATVTGACAAPVAVHAAADLDRSGALTAAVGVDGGETWVVRPDAHVAAVVRDEGALVAAVRRAIGHSASEQTGAMIGPEADDEVEG
jgi:pentachlorophenol monooxygenase/3-(3-hydroxy-phenyl)propionate hydroxylase